MDEEKKETIEEKKDDEDNTNINNKEFLEQLKAINDDDKISLEEIDVFQSMASKSISGLGIFDFSVFFVFFVSKESKSVTYSA